MARTMVKHKLSVHLPNCKGWPWVPPAVKSIHAGLAVACRPMHVTWRCCKKIMLAQLARTLTEWHCNSFTDLIDEMELWDWNVANKDLWSRWQSRCTVKKCQSHGQKKCTKNSLQCSSLKRWAGQRQHCPSGSAKHKLRSLGDRV